MKNRNPYTVIAIVIASVFGFCGLLAVIGALVPDPEQTAAPQKAAELPATPRAAETTEPATPSASPSPVVKQVKMPDLKDQNAAVAKDKLEKLGFTDISLGTQDLFDSWVVLPENWTVAKQSAKPGSSVSTDTLIVLTCTKLED